MILEDRPESGDQPFVKPETIDLLIAEYERSGSKIVIPAYDGVRGNPVVVDRSLFAIEAW